MKNDIKLKSYFSNFNPEITDNNFMELLSLKLNILDQIQIHQRRAKREMKIRIITTLTLGIISTLIISIYTWGVPLDINNFSHFGSILSSAIIRKITSIEIVSLAVATYIILIGAILHYLFSQYNLKHIRILGTQIKHITQNP